MPYINIAIVKKINKPDQNVIVAIDLNNRPNKNFNNKDYMTGYNNATMEWAMKFHPIVSQFDEFTLIDINDHIDLIYSSDVIATIII